MTGTLQTPFGPFDADDAREQRDQLHVRSAEQLFSRYQKDFTSLARGESSDTSRLGEFFADSLTLLTDDVFLPALGRDSAVALLSQQIDALRAAGYQQTHADWLRLRALNARAILIQAAWRRVGARDEIARFGTEYTICATNTGWRIAVMISTAWSAPLQPANQTQLERT